MEISKPAGHYSSNLISKLEILVLSDNPFEQTTLPIASSNTPVVDFQLTTDRDVYSDWQRIELKVGTNIGTGANGNTKCENDVFGSATVLKAGDRVVFINNKCHSHFSTSDVMINSKIFETPSNLYSHRPCIESELSHTQHCVKLNLITQGYNFETTINVQHNARQRGTQGLARKCPNGEFGGR